MRSSLHHHPRGSFCSLGIKATTRLDRVPGSSLLHILVIILTSRRSSSSWRIPALPSGRLPPLGCSGWDASLPPSLWSSYQRVSGQDGCCKPGKALMGKSSILLLFRVVTIVSFINTRFILSPVLMAIFYSKCRHRMRFGVLGLEMWIWELIFKMQFYRDTKGSNPMRDFSTADAAVCVLKWPAECPKMSRMSRDFCSNDI